MKINPSPFTHNYREEYKVITYQIVKITQFIITTLPAPQREHNRNTICYMFWHLRAAICDDHTQVVV